MSSRLLDNETICDLQGQPLRPDAAAALKALDRLLTVGAYYSADHDQYLQAARKTRDAIVGVIRAGRPVVAIEITAQGLMIDKQNVDPHHRNVRLLHDLLVPLNIARLEIHGTLSPEDLRQAVAALREHRTALGQASTFREIVIDGLPDSVRAVSRSVLHQGDAGAGDPDHADGDGAGDGPLSLDDLLSPWGDAKPAASESESERLARQFMEMVSEILENLQRLDRDGQAGTGGEGGTAVPREELAHLKAALQRLVDINPDPAELLQLITQARRALDLSRDPGAADLVFRILKRDLAGERRTPAAGAKKESRTVEYRFDVAGLFDEVDRLESAAAPLVEPAPAARTSRLGIALHLLASEPPEALRHGLLDIIEDAAGEPDFRDRGLPVCAAAVASAVDEDRPETSDELLSLLTTTLRRSRRDMLSNFWVRTLADCRGEHLVALWPHLVNDILLGFGKTAPAVVAKLVGHAGSLPLKLALGQGRRLARQPALAGAKGALDVFAVPVTETLPIHALAMTSPLKGWYGQALFDALKRAPISPLVAALTAALGEHRPELGTFYLDLIRHHQDEILPAALAGTTVEILADAIGSLPRETRGEAWVPAALGELAHLQPGRARPLLERVVGEKRFLFFPAWPAAVRSTAARALKALPREVG